MLHQRGISIDANAEHTHTVTSEMRNATLAYLLASQFNESRIELPEAARDLMATVSRFAHQILCKSRQSDRKTGKGSTTSEIKSTTTCSIPFFFLSFSCSLSILVRDSLACLSKFVYVGLVR